jgi:hypothetical protein
MIFQQNLYVDLNLRKEDLAEYLLSHGWQQVDHPNERMLVFDGLPDDEGTAIRVGLPASENFRDYYRRVYSHPSLRLYSQATASSCQAYTISCLIGYSFPSISC